MDVERIEVDREKARELYRAYKTHQHYQQPLDAAIQRAYQLIAQGRVIIKALESIRAAGVGADGLPKLAICEGTQGQEIRPRAAWADVSPHLTDAEVAEITDPLTQAAARRKFFERLGCKVTPKPNGQPLVSRADYDAAISAQRPRGHGRQVTPRAVSGRRMTAG